MSLNPILPNLYGEAFVIGIVYGSLVCISSCLPYVASYVAGIGAGFRRGVLVTLAFSFGRLAAYATIGLAIGLLSGALRLIVSAESFSPFQVYSSAAFGIVTIFIGLTILLKSKTSTCDINTKDIGVTRFQKVNRRIDLRAFLLGLTRGLVICPPLLALLLYALPFAAPIDGLLVAVLFGLGTVLSPLLLLGGVTGWLLNRAPLFRKWIAVCGGAILIVLGSITMVTSIMTL